MDATPTPAAVGNPASLPPTETSALAMWSLVFGVLGCTGIGAIIGLVCGIIAKVRIRKSGGRIKGDGLALAGIIVSAVMLLLVPVMAGLLLPAMAKAKAKAQTSQSMNNVRQIGLAAKAYSNEHNRMFPPPGNWTATLRPMLGPGAESVLHRPDDGPESECGYGYNLRVAGMPQDSLPPDTVLFFELQFPRRDAVGGPELLRHPQNANDRVVVGFADGSVRQLHLYDLAQLRWKP